MASLLEGAVMYKVRESRTLRKLYSGEIATCFKVNLVDSRSVEIAAMHGFDCIWTCMEHVGNDWSSIDKQVLAAKAYNADLLVRVARGSYSDYIKPFELDASGIMVPHVMSAEDAATVVRIAKFPPLGRRAVDSGNADGSYGSTPFLEYLHDSNIEKFVALQIEDPESINQLEQIASVKGYEILFFGPGDFSVALGDPGNFNNPRLLEIRRRIPELAKKYGKFAGTVCNTLNFNDLIDEGYKFLSIGADVLGLGQYCSSIAETLGIGNGKTLLSQYAQISENKKEQ